MDSTNAEHKPINDTDQEVVNVLVHKHMGFVVTRFPKTQEIISIVGIASGDGTPKSGVDIMETVFAFIAAIEPDMRGEQRGQFVLSLMTGAAEKEG